MAKKQTIDAKDFAVLAAQTAADRNCTDITVLDLKGISPATDYFVIATGTSPRQMKTVADEIAEAAHEHNNQRIGRAGYEHGKWILLDYADVIVHLFDEEHRDYYELDLLWGDVKKISFAAEGAEDVEK